MSAVFVYPVTLRRTIHRWIGWGSTDANFERSFELTFPPYPGLSISGDNEFQEQIAEVVFDTESGSFDCSCGNKSVYDVIRANKMPENDSTVAEQMFREMIEEELQNGWVRVDSNAEQR